MVTFNFDNVSGNATANRSEVLTFSVSSTPSGFFTTTSFPTINSTGQMPLQFTSALAGAGLPGDTMVFTISTSSNLYYARFSDATDSLDFGVSFRPTTSSTAIYTMTFDAGSGVTAMEDVSLQGARLTGNVEFLTASGTQSTGFDGEITGIRFTASPFAGSPNVTSLTGTPTCFAKGTRIAIPGGAAEVQDIAIGDTVLTADGGTREVLWVGRQSFDLTAGVPDHLRPVRIGAGALGEGLPERDLVVTADHALLLDGCLVNAGALVNGQTITLDGPADLGRRLTVFHVETEDHAMLLAEGCAAESFIDYTQRDAFDNATPEARIIPEAPYPRISAARHLPPHLRALVQVHAAA